MAPVPLSLWHVRERVVPVVGAGGVGSGDEADTGVKFVIAHYKCMLINRIRAAYVTTAHAAAPFLVRSNPIFSVSISNNYHIQRSYFI